MSKFALNKINAVNGKTPFYQLSIDGEKQLDVFEDEIRSNSQYLSQFKTIHRYMEQIANGAMLPNTKFRWLKGGDGETKEFEFKSKHLRVFGISMPDGKIIIHGGYKSSQEDHISKFRSLKKKYLSSLNNTQTQNETSRTTKK